MQSRFGVHIDSIAEGNLLDVRDAIERAKGCYAFGGDSLERYHNDPLAAELLWHFDFWRLRQLRQGGIASPRDILPPRLYRNVAIVFGDLCSFSSFVRDTPEDNLTRHCLTSFYSKARHQIVKHGGMLYQFVGDAVVGLFGIPDQSPGYIDQAVQASRSLLSIGASVSHHWQRHIDHAQATSGLRIGIALGDLQIVSFRPFSRTHVGVIGDAINIAARLQNAAEPNRIVVSNILYTHLPAATQSAFAERSPVQAKNLGSIKAWQTQPHPPPDRPPAPPNCNSPPEPT